MLDDNERATEKYTVLIAKFSCAGPTENDVVPPVELFVKVPV